MKIAARVKVSARRVIFLLLDGVLERQILELPTHGVIIVRVSAVDGVSQ